jgi:hypothetical protein
MKCEVIPKMDNPFGEDQRSNVRLILEFSSLNIAFSISLPSININITWSVKASALNKYCSTDGLQNFNNSLNDLASMRENGRLFVKMSLTIAFVNP